MKLDVRTGSHWLSLSVSRGLRLWGDPMGRNKGACITARPLLAWLGLQRNGLEILIINSA